ncbi:MAG TPA: hypothetical protein VGY55_21220 [Pirellulales bacterium]|jgi:hypothetical protein|nr:hypothetical protein [Pirellulales bacterium]
MKRRFQFSLQTLMIYVTLLTVVCGYLGWHARIAPNWLATVATMKSSDGGDLVGLYSALRSRYF